MQAKLFKYRCNNRRFLFSTLVLLEVYYYSSNSHSLAVKVYSKQHAPDREFFCCQKEILFALLCPSHEYFYSTQTVVRFLGKHDCLPAKKRWEYPPRSRERGMDIRHPSVGDASGWTFENCTTPSSAFAVIPLLL